MSTPRTPIFTETATWARYAPPSIRDLSEGNEAEALYEAWLALADSEGFKGDRMLFNLFRETLAGEHNLPTRFYCGTNLKTFDRVAADFLVMENDALITLTYRHGQKKVTARIGVALGITVTRDDALGFHPAAIALDADGHVIRLEAFPDTVLERTERERFRPVTEACATTAADAYKRLGDALTTAASHPLDEPTAEQIVIDTHIARSAREAILASFAQSQFQTRLDLALASAAYAREVPADMALKYEQTAGRIVTSTHQPEIG